MIGRVLVVDDNPVIVRMVADLLTADGFEVATANCADECMRSVAAFRPDLILMDVQLPAVDGLVLTRRIKSDPDNSHIKIVALTSYAMKGDRERAMAAGCDGYIAKPFDTRSLGKTVASYLPPSTQFG
jgi:CheY-like chemotaxis protein